jgi:hypothetical protein
MLSLEGLVSLSPYIVFTRLIFIGLVGGWIVQHLLMRGESPEAIRIIDICPVTRPSIAGKTDYVETDVSNTIAVEIAFKKPWPKSVAALPLTVFHCVYQFPRSPSGYGSFIRQDQYQRYRKRTECGSGSRGYLFRGHKFRFRGSSASIVLSVPMAEMAKRHLPVHTKCKSPAI